MGNTFSTECESRLFEPPSDSVSHSTFVARPTCVSHSLQRQAVIRQQHPILAGFLLASSAYSEHTATHNAQRSALPPTSPHRCGGVRHWRGAARTCKRKRRGRNAQLVTCLQRYKLFASRLSLLQWGVGLTCLHSRLHQPATSAPRGPCDAEAHGASLFFRAR